MKHNHYYVIIIVLKCCAPSVASQPPLEPVFDSNAGSVLSGTAGTQTNLTSEP